jgi:hypothetical protein
VYLPSSLPYPLFEPNTPPALNPCATGLTFKFNHNSKNAIRMALRSCKNGPIAYKRPTFTRVHIAGTSYSVLTRYPIFMGLSGSTVSVCNGWRSRPIQEQLIQTSGPNRDIVLGGACIQSGLNRQEKPKSDPLQSSRHPAGTWNPPWSCSSTPSIISRATVSNSPRAACINTSLLHISYVVYDV